MKNKNPYHVIAEKFLLRTTGEDVTFNWEGKLTVRLSCQQYDCNAIDIYHASDMTTYLMRVTEWLENAKVYVLKLREKEDRAAEAEEIQGELARISVEQYGAELRFGDKSVFIIYGDKMHKLEQPVEYTVERVEAIFRYVLSAVHEYTGIGDLNSLEQCTVTLGRAFCCWFRRATGCNIHKEPRRVNINIGTHGDLRYEDLDREIQIGEIKNIMKDYLEWSVEFRESWKKYLMDHGIVEIEKEWIKDTLQKEATDEYGVEVTFGDKSFTIRKNEGSVTCNHGLEYLAENMSVIAEYMMSISLYLSASGGKNIKHYTLGEGWK